MVSRQLEYKLQSVLAARYRRLVPRALNVVQEEGLVDTSGAEVLVNLDLVHPGAADARRERVVGPISCQAERVVGPISGQAERVVGPISCQACIGPISCQAESGWSYILFLL
jgi:hypothetical protein